MEKTRNEKIKLGIFVFIGFTIFTVAVYVIGNKQFLFGSGKGISCIFKDANGLQEGNNVRYLGINVGVVHQIKVISDTSVQVFLNIEREAFDYLRNDAVLTINADGIVGNMVVNILPGNGKGELVKSGDLLKAKDRINGGDIMGSLSVTVDNLALISSNLLESTETIKRGEGTIGQLINDSAFVEELMKTVLNLKSASKTSVRAMNQIKIVATKLNNDKSVAAKLLWNEKTGNDVETIISNLNVTSEDLASSISRVDSILIAVQQGKGTVNTLVYDTVVANDLKVTMHNIKEGSEQIDEVLEGLKESFLLKKYYKEKEKKEKKEKR